MSLNDNTPDGRPPAIRSKRELQAIWAERFDRFAADLYPDRYMGDYVQRLAEIGEEVLARAAEKQSTLVAHNYQYPELQEVADKVGDSLGLCQYVATRCSPRVDFCGVRFMGETARILLDASSRVFMPDVPGCSLVTSIDHTVIDRWRGEHPDGVIVSYINSDALTKSKSDYVCTSRNAAAVLRTAADSRPASQILFLPDKYLGAVALSQAGVAASRVTLYDGACHVHALIGEAALERALDEHPDAELLIHPECGCASTCMARALNGTLPHRKAYFFSTEEMLWHARRSTAEEFVVATEIGMVYRLRSQVPDKAFYPVSIKATCEYMKMITLEKLADGLARDRVEIEIAEPIRSRARAPIERMLRHA